MSATSWWGSLLKNCGIYGVGNGIQLGSSVRLEFLPSSFSSYATADQAGAEEGQLLHTETSSLASDDNTASSDETLTISSSSLGLPIPRCTVNYVKTDLSLLVILGAIGGGIYAAVKKHSKAFNSFVVNPWITSWDIYGENFRLSQFPTSILFKNSKMMYAFLGVDSEGNPTSLDSWADSIQGPVLDDLSKQYETYMAFGGWGVQSSAWLSLLSSPNASVSIQNFVNNIAKFSENYISRLNLIFDIEYLDSTTAPNFISLLQQLRNKYPDIKINAQLPAGSDKINQLSTETWQTLVGLLDNASIMTVNYFGSWSGRAWPAVPLTCNAAAPDPNASTYCVEETLNLWKKILSPENFKKLRGELDTTWYCSLVNGSGPYGNGLNASILSAAPGQFGSQGTPGAYDANCVLPQLMKGQPGNCSPNPAIPGNAPPPGLKLFASSVSGVPHGVAFDPVTNTFCTGPLPEDASEMCNMFRQYGLSEVDEWTASTDTGVRSGDLKDPLSLWGACIAGENNMTAAHDKYDHRMSAEVVSAKNVSGKPSLFSSLTGSAKTGFMQGLVLGSIDKLVNFLLEQCCCEKVDWAPTVRGIAQWLGSITLLINSGFALPAALSYSVISAGLSQLIAQLAQVIAKTKPEEKADNPRAQTALMMLHLTLLGLQAVLSGEGLGMSIAKFFVSAAGAVVGNTAASRASKLASVAVGAASSVRNTIFSAAKSVGGWMTGSDCGTAHTPPAVLSV